MGFWTWLLKREEENSIKRAEERWARSNEERRLAGCPCGKPATISKDDYRVVGSVPYKWWTCDEHYGADSFAGKIAMWPRSSPCNECPMDPNITEEEKRKRWHKPCHVSTYDGNPPHQWSCPEK